MFQDPQANPEQPSVAESDPDFLRRLIGADLGPPVKGRRQPWWRCPFHDDHKPSLKITPDGLHWKCWGACNRSGDAIAWLMERRGLTFPEAAAQVGRNVIPTSPVVRKPRPVVHCRDPREIDSDWSRRAETIIRECARALHHDSAKRARVWLLNRGLKPDTLLRWQIGNNPQDGERHGIWIERGITIPWFFEGQVGAINVRRPVGEPKYKMAAGSTRRGLYLADDFSAGRPTLITEGEFDALLAWQCLHDFCNVVTCGSAGDKPDRAALLKLITSPLILVAFDSDAAGKAASEVWHSLSARVRRIPIPAGKDITEFHQRGGDLAVWIRGELRLAGYTDGGMN